MTRSGRLSFIYSGIRSKYEKMFLGDIRILAIECSNVYIIVYVHIYLLKTTTNVVTVVSKDIQHNNKCRHSSLEEGHTT